MLSYLQIPNYEQFLEEVESVKEDFQFPYEVFSEVITYLLKTRQVLKDFPSYVLEFKVKSRCMYQ